MTRRVVLLTMMQPRVVRSERIGSGPGAIVPIPIPSRESRLAFSFFAPGTTRGPALVAPLANRRERRERKGIRLFFACFALSAVHKQRPARNHDRVLT